MRNELSFLAMVNWPTVRSYFQYSLFAMPLAALEVFTRSSLLIYTVGHYQIPPTILGPTLFLSLLLEIALQPWLGWRLSMNPNPRHAWRWILSGILMIGMATLLLFSAPQMISREGVIWLFPAMNLLLSLGFAFSGAPYLAVPLLSSAAAPVLSLKPTAAKGPGQAPLGRMWNWLLAIRMSFTFLGMAAGTVVPAWLADQGLPRPELQSAVVLTFSAFFLAVVSSWRSENAFRQVALEKDPDPQEYSVSHANSFPRPRPRLWALMITFLFELGIFVSGSLLLPFLIEVLRQTESDSRAALLKLVFLQILFLIGFAQMMNGVTLGNRQGFKLWAIVTWAIVFVWLSPNILGLFSSRGDWLTFAANQSGTWAESMALFFTASITVGSYLWQRYYLSTWPDGSLPLGLGYWRMVQRLAHATGSTTVGLIISWVGLRGFDPRIEDRLSTAYCGGVVLYWLILAVFLVLWARIPLPARTFSSPER